MQTVRFRRDQAGKVIALELTNPALRSITFTRVSDRTSRP
jgi:cell envelope opacity-associated protein A